MPAKHLAAPAAIEADDIIAVDGSPGGNRRGSLDAGFYRRFSKLFERLMNGRNQGGELIGRDLIASQIRAYNHRDEFGRRLIGHRLVPLFPTGNNIPTPVNSGRRFRNSISITPILNHPFVIPRPPLGEDPTGLSVNGSPVREVERDIYGGDLHIRQARINDCFSLSR